MNQTYRRKSALPAHKTWESHQEQILGSCMAGNSAFLSKCQKLDGQTVDLMDQNNCLNLKWSTKRLSIGRQPECKGLSQMSTTLCVTCIYLKLSNSFSIQVSINPKAAVVRHPDNFCSTFNIHKPNHVTHILGWDSPTNLHPFPCFC